LERLGIDGRIIFEMNATEKCGEGVDWIDLARVRWWDLVNGLPIK
jgi:hypothetical protein